MELNEIKFPSYYDTEKKGAKVFRVDSVPQYFVIDGKGKIRLHYRGAGFSQAKVVHRTLKKLIGGKRASGTSNGLSIIIKGGEKNEE